MEYLFGVLVLVLIYGLCATSENISLGYSGQFSAAQGALFATGAYAFALTTNAGVALVLGFVIAAAVGATAGAGVSFIANRLRGDYFLIVTMAFQFVLIDVIRNLYGVTGGEEGLAGLRPLQLGEFIPQSRGEWLLAVTPIVLVVGGIFIGLGRSRFGVILKAIREDHDATSSLGRETTRYKVAAFAAAAAGIAIAGALYASFISYIAPSQFTMHNLSVFIISAIVVGGVGNPFGPLAGVAVLMGITEGIRLIPELPLDVRAHLLQVIYAGLFLLFLIVRPQGLLPEGAFRRKTAASQRMNNADAPSG